MPGKRKIKFLKKKKSIDAKQNKDIKKLKATVKTLSAAVEVKFYDRILTKSDVTTLAQGTAITDLAPWDSNSVTANADRNTRREGNSVLIKSFNYRGVIEIPQGATSPADARVRVIVVHTPDSQTPAIFEVLSQPAAGDIDQFVNSYKRIKPANPYRVMYDKVFNLQSKEDFRAPVEGFRKNFNISLNFSKNPLKCTWQQGSLDQEPIQGCLSMYVFSNILETGVANPYNPKISGVSRMRFMDA